MTLEKKSKKYELSSNESFHEDTTPIDYLHHNRTSQLIKDALNEVIFYRPDDPIQFLVDYFMPLDKSVVDEAYKMLRRCQYQDMIYQRNVLEVYNMLQLVNNKGSNLRGLLGETFNNLLEKIHIKTPESFKSKWLGRLKVHKTCVVDFRHFYDSILRCFVMEDFLAICSSLYNDLDTNSCGKANRELCLILLDSIKCNDHEQTPFDYFIENIHKTSSTFPHSDSEHIERNDFISKAIDIFIGC